MINLKCYKVGKYRNGRLRRLWHVLQPLHNASQIQPLDNVQRGLQMWIASYTHYLLHMIWNIILLINLANLKFNYKSYTVSFGFSCRILWYKNVIIIVAWIRVNKQTIYKFIQYYINSLIYKIHQYLKFC